MQTSILMMGIILAGQISESVGGRYGELPTAPPPTSQGAAGAPAQLEQPVGQQPWNGGTQAAPPAESNQKSLVAPPRVEQTAPPVGLTKVTTAADLLSHLSQPVGTERLVGVPLSLADTVRDTPSRAEQAQRVRLYWELSEAVTCYYLDSLSELELQSLRNGLVQASPGWTSAQQAAAARKRVSLSAVELAQVRLQRALGQTGDTNLPLPADLPHCGAYETKYEQIFRDRGFKEAKQLSELLPLRHEELGRRAIAAMTARDWLIELSKQRGPHDDGARLLKSYENLVAQRQAFASTIYDYNADIARYTELAVPQNIDTVRLVSMLIQAEVADNTANNTANAVIEGTARGIASVNSPGEPVRQTSAEEALPPSNGGVARERTFVGGQRSEVRRPPAGKQRGERSILVAPEN